MGIFQSGYDTYQAHLDWVGEEVEGRQPLCPVGHALFKAQLEISLDIDGNFQNAVSLNRKNGAIETIIPVTESSASRSSGPVAHPLCEQVEYVNAPVKPDEKSLYTDLLTSWKEKNPHWFLNAVCTYVENGTLLSDLKASGLLKGNTEDDILKEKIEGTEIRKCLIRWVVAGHKCWSGQTAKELMDSWASFYQNTYAPQHNAQNGFCMITGGYGTTTNKADKGVVRSAYGAKLISSNDDKNFTYRGRFQLPEQACTVSYEGSQKAHRGISWITVNQGVIVGGRTFVCWNPAGKHVENPQNSLNLFAADEEISSPTEYQERLRQAMDGFQMDLPDKVVIAAFDAATTGRLSLTFYSEMPGETFYRRLYSWYESCQWPNGKRSPQPFTFLQFGRFAYGTERSSGLLEAGNASLKRVVQRLTECMIYGARVPSEVVMALVKNASEPQRYKNKSNQYRILRAACMLLRKELNDRAEREEWTLALDPTKMDRSYQFGRLLALYDQVEQAANRKKEVTDRPTNATKYRSVFRVRPWATVSRLEEKLIPYFNQLDPGLRGYFKGQIGEIMQMLSNCGTGEMDRPLEDVYLMGYYLQLYNNRGRGAVEEPETDDASVQDD